MSRPQNAVFASRNLREKILSTRKTLYREGVPKEFANFPKWMTEGETLKVDYMVSALSQINVNLGRELYNQEVNEYITKQQWLETFSQAPDRKKKAMIWNLVIGDHDGTSGGENSGYVDFQERFSAMSERNKKIAVNAIVNAGLLNQKAALTQMGLHYVKFLKVSNPALKNSIRFLLRTARS